MENNIAWHKLTAQNRLAERTRGWWESLQVNTAYNTTDTHTAAYQPGGVGVFSINKIAHRVQSVGKDPEGLGRYCWTVFYGKDYKRLRIIAAYRPSKSKNGHLSVTQQHWRHLTLQSPKGAQVEHPRIQFWKDLKPLLQAWSNDGEQIIMGIDANETINQPEITEYFNSVGMTEAILHRHGTDAPPTHQCGSQAIDGIFVTNGLLGFPSGYLSGLAGISGDHRCLWMDIPEQWLFGGQMPVIVRPGARRLKSDDPRIRQRYLDNLEAFFRTHLLLEKTQQIDSDANAMPLQPQQELELERLDALRIQGMIQAERQCRKLHTRPYGWTPELTQLMAEIKYWRFSLRQAEGKPVNARLMYRLARAFPPPQLPQISVAAIKEQLYRRKILLKKKLGDPNRRETWLESLAEAQSAETGGDPAKRLRHLIRTEEQRLHARQIRRVNNTARGTGGLAAVTVAHPDGTLSHYSDKANMEAACLEEARARFTQANDTPFLTEPLLPELGLLNCEDPPFDAIANGQYQAPAGTGPGAQLLLQHLKRPMEVPDCPLELMAEGHKEGWIKSKERTASSLSGAHFGHYKSGTFNDLINGVHTALAVIPLKTGYSYTRWRKGINIMLEKSTGNFQVDKLRIILLFEADFNQLNKFIGREMMYHAEQYGLVAGEQYGSRHGRSSITQSLNKRLTFDQFRQLKQAATVCSNDATSCYDRIVHRIAAQSMYRCGVPKPALICMFSTIQRLQHHIRTLFGDSQISAGTDLWAVPISGIGQGNGAGPQIWAVVSTPILDILRNAGYGATFKLAISGASVSFVGYSFVDDTDLVQTGPSLLSTGQEVLPLMQAALSLWEQGLRATGGALVPSKSFWYHIDFKWNGSHWRYAKGDPGQNTLLMRDHTQTSSPIQQLQADDAQRTLGVYLAPDGNNKKQLQILLTKTKMWADKARTGHLNKVAAWLNLTSTILRQVHYVLPATTLTQTQCDQVMAPCYRRGLPAVGIMCSFPRAILQAPYDYYGLGITNLYLEQGIQHILAILRYGPNNDDSTGKLIRLGLETLHLELGLNGHLLSLDWPTLHHMTTPTWITHTWRFMHENGISIETNTPEIPMSREGDQLLTNLFLQAGIRGKDLAALNRCRLFLQVVTLADISDGSGHYITDAMLSGKANTTFTSGFTWPNQGQPTKKEWAQWHLGLHLAIPVDNLGRLQQPLGRWLLPWSTNPHQWHWLVTEQPLRLFHWDQEWQVHLPLTTRATRQLKFHKRSTRSTQQPPAAALRVTCTQETNHFTASGRHGQVETDPKPTPTWREHLATLPKDKKWALANLNLLHDGAPLGEAIRAGQARAVSDGSFKECFGTAAWVFYHNETNRTLGNGRLITPGGPHDQCAYRSELAGLYGIALTLNELSVHQDFTGGQIKVACDGESALHRCFKPWDANPLAKHFDLIQATRTAIRNTPLAWSWEHVRGHQDDTDTILTVTEQRNIDMDAAAKEHWQAHHTQRQGTTVRIHGEGWRVFLGKRKISTNLKRKLLDHTAGQAAKAYWAGKTCFRDIDIDLVDWQTIANVVQGQTISMRRWTSKFTTGFCATGRRMIQLKKRATADCPRCGSPNEDTDHILQCPEVESQQLWDSAIQQLRENLRENDTDPSIIEDLSEGIDAWRRNVPPPPGYTPAGQAQAYLTWRNLAHGFLSPAWKIQQANYYTNRNNPASVTNWAADLLRFLLKTARRQWDHRNQVLHKTQPDRVKDQALNIEIRLQYDRGRDSLPRSSKTLLDAPLERTLGLPHHEKQQWIISVKTARKRQRTTAARIAAAQRNLMEQIFRRTS